LTIRGGGNRIRGIEYSGLKVFVGLVVHALWPTRECRCHARLTTKPNANIVGAAQCPVIAIFSLRGVGQPITMTAFARIPF
jgi:hypothetical protein